MVAVPTKLGRYEIVKHLANGGMAQVLIARATGIEGFARHVVVKRIHAEHAADPTFVQMFLDEARVAAALHHNNIVQVHDIGKENGEYFFAMEYVHGHDLRMLLKEASRRREKVPWEHVVTIMTSAAAGLHHAHELRGPDRKLIGLVHRDVSPANILIGYDGTVKMVDFGIAKAALRTGEGTKGGALKGKVSYMAPEQCAGKQIDRRSDVYALGVVLYELSTVRRLFKGENDFLTMSAIVAGDIPPPIKVRPDIPPLLDAIILKALAKKPSDRFQTADEMREALEDLANELKLRTSNGALATYMKQMFGAQPEPWLVDDKAEPDRNVDFDGSNSGMAQASEDAQKNLAIPDSIESTMSSPIARARRRITSAPPMAMQADGSTRHKATGTDVDNKTAITTTIPSPPVKTPPAGVPAVSRTSTASKPATIVIPPKEPRTATKAPTAAPPVARVSASTIGAPGKRPKSPTLPPGLIPGARPTPPAVPVQPEPPAISRTSTPPAGTPATPTAGTPAPAVARTATPAAGTPAPVVARTATPPAGIARTVTPPAGTPRSATPPTGVSSSATAPAIARTATPPAGTPRTTPAAGVTPVVARTATPPAGTKAPPPPEAAKRRTPPAVPIVEPPPQPTPSDDAKAQLPSMADDDFTVDESRSGDASVAAKPELSSLIEDHIEAKPEPVATADDSKPVAASEPVAAKPDRKKLAIIAGAIGLGVVLLIIFLATRGGDSRSETTAPPKQPDTPAVDPPKPPPKPEPVAEPPTTDVGAGSAAAGSAGAGSAHAGSADAGSADAGSADAGSASAGSGSAVKKLPPKRPPPPRKKWNPDELFIKP